MVTKYEKANRGKLLAVIMMVAVMFVGIAVVSIGTTDAVSETDVARIGDTGYVSFEDAVGAIPKDGSGTTVVLLKGVTVESELDFKGATIDTKSNVIRIESGSIINGTVVGNDDYIDVAVHGDSTIDNIKFTGFGYFPVDITTGTVTIQNCVFDSTMSTNPASAIYLEPHDAQVTVSNCKFIGDYAQGAINFDMGTDKIISTAKVTITSDEPNPVSIGSCRGAMEVGTNGKNVAIGENVEITEIILDIDNNYSSTEGQVSKITVTNGSFAVETIKGNGSVEVSKGATLKAQSTTVPVIGEGEIDVTDIELDSFDDVITTLENDPDADILFSSTEPVTLTKNVEIGENQTLTIENTTVNGGEFDFVVEGAFNINNSFIYAGVDVDEDNGGEVNVSNAHNLTSTGVVNSETMVGYGDTLTLSGTVPAGKTVEVYGTLITNDLTVAGTVNAYVGSTVTIDGIVNVSGQFILNDADIELSGTVNVRNDTAGGAIFQLVGTSEMTVLDGANFNVYKPTANAAADNPNKLMVASTSEFIVEGTLTITGLLDGTILDKGTINFNGTAAKNSKIVLFDGVSFTVGSVAGTLTVTDTGAVDDYAGSTTSNKSEGNTVTLTDVKGVTIAETVTTEVKENVRYYFANMDVTGSFIALDDQTKTANVTLSATVNAVNEKCGKITLIDTVVVGKSVTLVNSGVLTVAGDVSVNKDGAFTNDGTITVDGSVTMTDKILAGTVNAMFYSVTGTENTMNYYTNFADAIAEAANADSDTVYVLGTVNVTADAEISAGTYVNVRDTSSTLVIKSGYTVTVADGAALNVTGTVDVKGTLVITNTDTGLTLGVLKYDVYKVNGKTATYTSLANALANSNPGDVITISQNVVISENTTIPTDVTVQTGKFSITLKKDVTLTVDGTLAIQKDGSLVSESRDPALVWGKDVKLVVNGVVSDANTDANVSKYNSAGAIFTLKNVKYLTSVAYAAEKSSEITADGITVNGNISFGDVTFTKGDKAADLTVTFSKISDDDVFNGNVTLVGSSMSVESGKFNGNVTAAASGTDAVISLSNATDFTIGSTKDVTGLEPVNVMTIGGIEKEDGEENKTYVITGTVTIQSGTVTAKNVELGNAKTDKFTVASGATLQIVKNKDGTTNTVTIGTGADVGMTVDGTLAVKSGTLKVTGKAIVNGTMTVDGNAVSVSGVLNIIGTLQISEDEKTVGTVTVTTTGRIVVGAVPSMLGQTSSGSISGKVAFNGNAVVLVYNGSSVADANMGNTVYSTAYHINGTAYATAYATNTSVDVRVALGAVDLSGLDFSKAKWYSDSDMTEPITSETVGVENVYIDVPASYKTGTISAGTGLDLYIDNVKWNGVLNELSVGTHDVRFEVRAGYDGSAATITFNGQTVTDGKITITADMKDFTLVASGAVPMTGGSTGSSDNGGMTLVEILLIVLVVMVVILAIVVILRMMRS